MRLGFGLGLGVSRHDYLWGRPLSGSGLILEGDMADDPGDFLLMEGDMADDAADFLLLEGDGG